MGTFFGKKNLACESYEMTTAFLRMTEIEEESTMMPSINVGMMLRPYSECSLLGIVILRPQLYERSLAGSSFRHPIFPGIADERERSVFCDH